MLSKIKDFLLSSLAICFVFFSFYFTINWIGNKYENYVKTEISKYPAETECIVTDLHTYKEKSISVEYFVNNERYTHREGIKARQLYRIEVGQKLRIRYSSKDPDLAEVIIPFSPADTLD